jgi:hypothetical protein
MGYRDLHSPTGAVVLAAPGAPSRRENPLELVAAELAVLGGEPVPAAPELQSGWV